MGLNFFKRQETYPPLMTDKAQIDKTYKFWRINLMIASYAGYAIFYFTRKSLTFAQADIIESALMTKEDLGLLATIFYITYGFSKFLSGMLSDSSNPRYFMATGLIMTGIINIIFGFSDSFYVFAILWALNAFFQGWGWPPSATILNNWYSRNERGFWWSIWNTSHNLGGLLIPLLAGYMAQHYGWSYAMFAPGVIAIIVGISLAISLRDKPQTMGLPEVGEWRQDKEEIAYAKASTPMPTSKILVDYILKNKFMWILAITWLSVYVIRTSINDWGNLYMKNVLHLKIIESNAVITYFELGGFIGSIAAGWGSDLLFKGNRVPMTTLFCVGVLATAIVFFMIASQYTNLPTEAQMALADDRSVYITHSILFALLGFFIFGPQMLIGMLGAETTHKDAAGTATGYLSIFAYLGAALSGYPIAKLISAYGWYGFFYFLAGISLVVLALMLIFQVMDKMRRNKLESLS